MKKIGVIGESGRMGILLCEVIKQHPNYDLGPGFSKSNELSSLNYIFKENDYVIDFSSANLIEHILTSAIKNPKPLVICTTGWSLEKTEKSIDELSKIVPVVISSNTSVGACIQRYLVKQLSKLLDNEYDIDILERHHRNKIDSPSGTAKSLIKEVQKEKLSKYNLDYKSYDYQDIIRPDNYIGMMVQRAGNLAGEHEVTFTSMDEMISVKHTAFNRSIFANGSIKCINWLEKNKPTKGIYNMLNILGLE